MSTLSRVDEYIGILPSKATGDASSLVHGDAILDILASFIRALDYSDPPIPWKDHILKRETIKELQSWGVGESMDEVIRYLDVGLAVAEVCSNYSV